MSIADSRLSDVLSDGGNYRTDFKETLHEDTLFF